MSPNVNIQVHIYVHLSTEKNMSKYICLLTWVTRGGERGIMEGGPIKREKENERLY